MHLINFQIIPYVITITIILKTIAVITPMKINLVDILSSSNVSFGVSFLTISEPPCFFSSLDTFIFLIYPQIAIQEKTITIKSKNALNITLKFIPPYIVAP